MAGKKGMKHKEKVMYDPYNFAKVAEKFKADQQKEKEEAKKARERAAKLKQKRQALNKVKQNQRKITEKVTKEIKGGEKRLAKSAKTLEKVGKKKVTGPLGTPIKVKTLSKITGGAPGLDRGIRSKMFIGKKLNMGGYTVTNRFSKIMLPEKKRTTRIT